MVVVQYFVLVLLSFFCGESVYLSTKKNQNMFWSPPLFQETTEDKLRKAEGEIKSLKMKIKRLEAELKGKEIPAGSRLRKVG